MLFATEQSFSNIYYDDDDECLFKLIELAVFPFLPFVCTRECCKSASAKAFATLSATWVVDKCSVEGLIRICRRFFF